VETTLLEDPSYSELLLSLVSNLAEDIKLSACGRHPSYFSCHSVLFYFSNIN
jgi:hypothetical protein